MMRVAIAVFVLALIAQTPAPFPHDHFICNVLRDANYVCGDNDSSGQVDRARSFVTGCMSPDDNDACKPRIHHAVNGTPYVDECPARTDPAGCFLSFGFTVAV
jgi:hypothetical protein